MKIVRNSVAFFLILFFAALPGGADAVEAYVYLPLDHVEVPVPGPEWKVRIGEGKTRVEFTQLSGEGVHPGVLKSVVRLIREPLPVGMTKSAVWQREVKRDLEKDHKGVKTEKIENSLYQAGYAYTEDLIPVQGSRLYSVYKNWLYEWQCELERELGKDAYAWCLEEFRKIRWPESLPQPTADRVSKFAEFARNIPLDLPSLQRAGEGILLAFQNSPLTLNQLHRYASHLIVRTLLAPPTDPEKRSVLLENLTRLADTIERFPESKVLASWLRAHRDFLEGRLTYQRLEEMVQQEERPPYWLLSLWVEPVNSETSVYLARREKRTEPLHHFVLGKVLADSGRTQEAIPPLTKAARQRNTLAMNALARAWLDSHQTDKARKVARSALRKDPGNIESWLILALAVGSTEDDEAESDQIYDNLLARGDLTPDDRIKIYLQRAKTALNPMARLMFHEEILKLEPGHLESLYAVGRLQLLEKNDKEKGLEFFERYLDTAPPEDNRITELTRMVKDLRIEIHGYWNAPGNDSVYNREVGQ